MYTTYVDRCIIEGGRGIPRECDTPRTSIHLLPAEAVTLLSYFVGASVVCLSLFVVVWYLAR
jgi:hypothetical protein